MTVTGEFTHTECTLKKIMPNHNDELLLQILEIYQYQCVLFINTVLA